MLSIFSYVYWTCLSLLWNNICLGLLSIFWLGSMFFWYLAACTALEINSLLTDDAVKVLHSICQLIWKTQQWPQDWKKSIFIQIPKEVNAKECSNNHTIALISRASKVMLKILQARLQQYMNRELPDVQAGFRKGRGTRDQIANIHCIIEKAREF